MHLPGKLMTALTQIEEKVFRNAGVCIFLIHDYFLNSTCLQNWIPTND